MTSWKPPYADPFRAVTAFVAVFASAFAFAFAAGHQRYVLKRELETD